MILAADSALGLAGIDAVHVSKRNIRPVYFVDMVTELLLVYAWTQVKQAPRQENRG